MAKFNMEYYGGTDLYSDGDVENEILEIAKAGKTDLDPEKTKFPVLYHLSGVRENILNWYPFREGAIGLEIGSGCGAITGLLCRKMKKVVSVELSKRRAEINYSRHKDLENLEICVGNLNDMKFEGKFDYVVLNGVFEYAMGFTSGEKPYEQFLNNVSSYLKEDGILLVAIENRLGLKYFAGAPEDHTDGYFDGIREYEDNRSVRTFSKSEWEELMRHCGLEYYRFYYPYPDYKFPKEIFTDESLKNRKYGLPTWNFTKYRMALFQEEKMAETLSEEGIMDRFANSFLIEMSRSPISRKKEVVYAKLSTDRRVDYGIVTVIEEEVCSDGAESGRSAGEVRKCAATGAAISHLDRMHMQMKREYGSWKALQGESEKGTIIYPYLTGNSFGRQAELAVQKKDLKKIRRLLHQIDQILRAQDGKLCLSQEMTQQEQMQFKSVFGEYQILEDVVCISPANIDMILDNIFETDGHIQVIDCEWIFDFPVPITFILWRAINELYTNNRSLGELISRSDLQKEFQITSKMEEVFTEWATCFAEQYVGANRLLKASIPEIGISIEEFRQRIRAKETRISQLFVDTGKGFNEEEKIVAESEVAGGQFTVQFDLSSYSSIRALRFDPLEGQPCICKIEEKNTSHKLIPANAAAKVSQGDLFLTTDPIYQVKSDASQKKVTICAEVQLLTMEEALSQASQMLAKGSRLTFWKRK